MWKKLQIADKLSPSTVYRAIKSGVIKNVSSKKHLMYHGKKTKNPKLAIIKPHQTIHDRSQIVEECIRLGDWEGDTIIGSEQKSAFVTLVDRTTRFLVAGIIPNRKASSVNKMSWLAYAIPSIS